MRWRWWPWCGLVGLAALPLPWPLPGVPGNPLEWQAFLWFWLFGLGLFLREIARTSLPLAGLLGWAVVRVGLVGWPLRGLWVLSMLLVAAWICHQAARVPSAADRWLQGGLLVAAGGNLALGVVNLAGWYPGLWVAEHVRGLPVGLLNHPNHWGLFLALAWPSLWAVTRAWSPLGRIVATWGGLGLIAASQSRMAVAGALAAWVWLEGRHWRRLPAGATLGLAGVGLGALTWWLLTYTHGWGTLGGRGPVWRLALTHWWTRARWLGIGLGGWRAWALDPRGPVTALHGPKFAGWWTEAHGEPVQLLFELGLVGAGLGAWLLWDVAQQFRRGDPVWGATVLVGLVSMWGTIPFHMPALAIPLLIAAGRCHRRPDGS